MSNAVLGPEGVVQRYQTHRSQLLTLWVTRQGEEFVLGNDLQLCDIELISSSVELMGEPGTGNTGYVNDGYALVPSTDAESLNGYMNSINTLAVNNAGVTSTVYNRALENRILMKPHLHHGHVDIRIEGLHQPHQFRRDTGSSLVPMSMVVPTDLGMIQARLNQQAYPPQPIMFENVKLAQRIKVNSFFAGTSSEFNRVARFVEDWADATGNRNADGTVRIYTNNDEGTASTEACIAPANLINVMKLVFKVMPRTIL